MTEQHFRKRMKGENEAVASERQQFSVEENFIHQKGQKGEKTW